MVLGNPEGAVRHERGRGHNQGKATGDCGLKEKTHGGNSKLKRGTLRGAARHQNAWCGEEVKHAFALGVSENLSTERQKELRMQGKTEDMAPKITMKEQKIDTEKGSHQCDLSRGKLSNHRRG